MLYGSQERLLPPRASTRSRGAHWGHKTPRWCWLPIATAFDLPSLLTSVGIKSTSRRGRCMFAGSSGTPRALTDPSEMNCEPCGACNASRRRSRPSCSLRRAAARHSAPINPMPQMSLSTASASSPGDLNVTIFYETPRRIATSPARSGATPSGSPTELTFVTSRKFDKLIPARDARWSKLGNDVRCHTDAL